MSKEKAIVHINNVSKMIGSKRIKLSEGTASHIQNELVLALKEVEEQHTKKIEPIEGLSQDMYNLLVSHCESKVKRLKDSIPWLPVYNEHRIFLELLKRVGRDFVEKEK